MRRVITGHSKDGRSVIISDGEPGRVVTLESNRGFKCDEIWATDSVPSTPVEHSDPTISMSSFVPGSNGTRFRIVCMPPASKGVDPVAVKNEQTVKMPGIGELLDVKNPGMHTTSTIDYGIVLSGEIWLELDDGAKTLMKKGDCIVQNGTRHAWRNFSTAPCLIAFVMIGTTSGEKATTKRVKK